MPPYDKEDWKERVYRMGSLSINLARDAYRTRCWDSGSPMCWDSTSG